MQANRRRDTGPERALRSALHARGMRFRVDLPLRARPGRAIRPDVVFTRPRVAIFVDGCFWHGCPLHGTQPKSNVEWWRAKIQRNRQRDLEQTEALVGAGWAVLRVWEHEQPDLAAEQIRELVFERSSGTSRRPEYAAD